MSVDFVNYFYSGRVYVCKNGKSGDSIQKFCGTTKKPFNTPPSEALHDITARKEKQYSKKFDRTVCIHIEAFNKI